MLTYIYVTSRSQYAILKSFILTWRACLIACSQGHCVRVHVYISELIPLRRHRRCQQRHLAKPDATTHTYIDHLAKPDVTTHTLTLTTTLTQNLTLTQKFDLDPKLTLTPKFDLDPNSTLTQTSTLTQNSTLAQYST